MKKHLRNLFRAYPGVTINIQFLAPCNIVRVWTNGGCFGEASSTNPKAALHAAMKLLEAARREDGRDCLLPAEYQ